MNILKFCSWNIHGYKSRQLGNKLHSKEFLNELRDQDFIGLTETHIHDEILENLSIPGFKRLSHKVQMKNLKSNTAPGGIAVFVKESLTELFSPVNTDNEDIAWVKIKKETSGGQNDIYIGTSYLSPTKGIAEKIAKLMEETSMFQAKGHVLINGDFNARTGTQEDIILHDKYDAETGIENSETTPKRNSQDKHTNKRGDDLLDMCKSLELKIANGRKLGDPFGSYTCLKWNGNSVVDYLLTSTAIFDQVPTFQVGQYLPMLSDHCPLFYTLEINEDLKKLDENHPLKQAPKQFSWPEQGTEKFLAALKNTGNDERLDSILKSNFTDPSAVVDTLSKFLIDVADKENIKKVPVSKSTSIIDPPWFDKACSKLKKEIRSQGKKVKREPNNENYKRVLTGLKRSLKRTVRKNKFSYKESILQKMNWSRKDTKQFWKLLDKLEYNQNDDIFLKGISGDRWKVHFKNVLYNPTIKSDIQFPVNTTESGPLDFEISDEEIKLAAYILRKGKSPGIDCISNEMISCLVEAKPEIINKLFNAILKHPMVIDKWHLSMISPIHKNGSKMNPDNYRGISLLSCFAKFFCAILNKRLLTYVIDNRILSKAQLGFMPGNRTSDALLALHNLIDYYCHRNKKYLFGCFVDFSKAFDTIPRQNLFKKLLDHNISGKFYDCLTMLYNGDQACVKMGNNITDSFQSNQGVKQGCILSPLLFNIYLSDFQKNVETDENRPAVIAQNDPLGCLIWADDVLLLSQTEAGLNNMLKVLRSFAEENGLTVNMKKTKVMIFNNTGRHIRRNFYLGDSKVETTNEYKYLGFKVTPFGGIIPGLHDLKDRAQKAYFKMKKKMGQSFRSHPQVTTKLFETLIQPILLYASDFWGILKMPKNNPIENLHMKFCKELLGVQRQTTNVGVLLELGQVPLGIKANKNAIKNWCRITNDPKCNKLVISSYNNAINYNLAWPSRVKDVLSQIGMLDIFNNQDSKAHERAFQRMCDIFHQNSFEEIKKESSKLRTYGVLKTEIGYESYLSQIKDTQVRISLTKFRLSNHNLMIEKGRHQKIEKNLRFCPFCPGKIEDEIHFLMECQAFKTIREEMLTQISNWGDIIQQLEDRDKFIFLLTNQLTTPTSASYIYRMSNIREFLINKHKNPT